MFCTFVIVLLAFVLGAVATYIVVVGGTIFSAAEDGRQNEPGKFDYYVLALSWSPSYCAASAERVPTREPDQQCAGRPFAFVVHGLWPQYEHGFPSYCQVPAPRLDHAIVGSALDLMPTSASSSLSCSA